MCDRFVTVLQEFSFYNELWNTNNKLFVVEFQFNTHVTGIGLFALVTAYTFDFWQPFCDRHLCNGHTEVLSSCCNILPILAGFFTDTILICLMPTSLVHHNWYCLPQSSITNPRTLFLVFHNLFIARQCADARYWYSNSVCPSVRDTLVLYGNGLTYRHSFLPYGSPIILVLTASNIF